MALRFRTELDVAPFVAGADKGAAAAKAFREELLATSAAAKDLGGAAGGAFGKGAAPPRGSGGGSARSPASPKASPEDKAAKERKKDADWLAGVKSKSLADEWKAQEKAAAKRVADQAKASKEIERLHAGTVKWHAANSKAITAAHAKSQLDQLAASKDFRDKDVKAQNARAAYLPHVLMAAKVAAIAAVGFTTGAAAAGVYFSKFAMGYRGMWALNALTMRAQWNFRSLFRGVDPSPVIRAYDRVLAVVNPRSFLGATVGDLLTKSFNGAFKILERMQPLFNAFATGVVYGALLVEEAFLTLQLVLLDFGVDLGDLKVTQDGLSAAFRVGVGVFVGAAVTIGLVAGAAIAAGGAIALFAYNVGEVVTAFDNATKSVGDFLNLIAKVQSLSPTGMIAQIAGGAVNQSEVFGPKTAGGSTSAMGDMVASSKSAGTSAGAAMGAGMVAGMASKAGDVTAAGNALAKAADAGVKAGAEIHSPSALFRRRTRQMGEGAELGFHDAAPGVQRAAADGLVPGMPGGAGRAGGDRTINVNFYGDVHGDKGGIAAVVREAIDDRLEDISIAMGGAAT